MQSRLARSALIVACLVVMPLGCTVAIQFPLNASGEAINVWEPVALDNLKRKYQDRLTPNDDARVSSTSASTNLLGWGGTKTTSQIHFTGVRQAESEVLATFGSLQIDVTERITSTGATIEGEARKTQNKGGVNRIEFDYVKGRVTGQVYLEAKPGRDPGTWDVDCMVWEKFR